MALHVVMNEHRRIVHTYGKRGTKVPRPDGSTSRSSAAIATPDRSLRSRKATTSAAGRGIFTEESSQESLESQTQSDSDCYLASAQATIPSISGGLQVQSSSAKLKGVLPAVFVDSPKFSGATVSDKSSEGADINASTVFAPLYSEARSSSKVQGKRKAVDQDALEIERDVKRVTTPATSTKGCVVPVSSNPMPFSSSPVVKSRCTRTRSASKCTSATTSPDRTIQSLVDTMHDLARSTSSQPEVHSSMTGSPIRDTEAGRRLESLLSAGNGHLSQTASKESQPKDPLTSSISFENLFDGLLGEVSSATHCPRQTASPQRTKSLREHMASKGDDNARANLRVQLSSSPSGSRTPVKLGRSHSWASTSSPGSVFGHTSTPAASSPRKDSTLSASSALQRAIRNPSDPVFLRGDNAAAECMITSSPRRHASGLKRTYSGRHVAPDQEPTSIRPFSDTLSYRSRVEGGHHPSPVIGRPLLQQSYSEMSKRLGGETDDGGDIDDDPDTSNLAIDIHSVNHLRSAGESKRFTDEMSYLLEGYEESAPVSMHRASCLELVRKLVDQDFLRKLRTYGFVETVYSRFRNIKAGEGDRILDTAFLTFLCRISGDRQGVEDLLKASRNDAFGCLNLLRAIMNQKWLSVPIQQPYKTSGKSEKLALEALGSIARANCPQAFSSVEGSQTTSGELMLQTLSNLAMHIDDTLPIFIEYDLLSPFESQSYAMLQHLDNTRDLEAHDRSLSNIAAVLDRLTATGVQVTESGTHTTDDTIGIITRLLSALLVNVTRHTDSVSASVLPLCQAILLNICKSVLEAVGSTTKWSAAAAFRDPCFTQSLLCGVSSLANDLEANQDVKATYFNRAILALTVLETMLESDPSFRSAFKASRIDKPCICIETCRCHEAGVALNIIIHTLCQEFPDTEHANTELVRGLCNLIIIYGTINDDTVQGTVFKGILSRSPERLSELHSAIGGLIDLQEQADELGLQASSTMKEELGEMLRRIEITRQGAGQTLSS